MVGQLIKSWSMSNLRLIILYSRTPSAGHIQCAHHHASPSTGSGSQGAPTQHSLGNLAYTKQKIFYNRSTNSAASCALKWMSLQTPFPSMKFKRLTIFLLQGFQPIMIKGWAFSQSGNPYAP